MAAEIERSLKTSPLLSDAVIERDYTKGIESQLSGNNKQPASEPEPKADETTTKPDNEPQKPAAEPTFQHDIKNEPAGFSFDQETADPSDVTDTEAPGMAIPSGNAKELANFVGDLIKIYVPEATFSFVKIDMASIESHIQSGNISPSLREVFVQINANTHEALQFNEESIKMWKKAFKNYVESQNIEVSPGTQLLIATGVLGFEQYMKYREGKAANEQWIYNAINSYNPGYFDSFRAKMEKPPKETKGDHEEANKAKVSEPEKTEV